MQSNENQAVAIIGYGTAGVNAAIALRLAGYDGAIRVFSDTGILPYSPILTSYYAGGEKTYEDCFPWSEAELDELELDVLANSPVVELDPAAHAITTPDGTFPYTKCIVATGATPMCLGFPGVDGDEAYQPLVLRSMDDAERLKATIEDPKCQRMLVSGASMVALKTLEACLNHGLDCTLVGMNPHVLDFNALPEAAERFERGLVEKGVTLRLGTTIALVVDEFMRTSDPDVYAAGDVAQATELISGQKRIVGIWKNAALQGACAGRTIAAELAGEKSPADCALAGSISTNTIAVNGTLFISAGTMEVTDDRWVEVHEDDKMTVVYVFERTDAGARRLVGFNLTCDEDVEGSKAYDTGAMLTLKIERGCRDR